MWRYQKKQAAEEVEAASVYYSLVANSGAGVPGAMDHPLGSSACNHSMGNLGTSKASVVGPFSS